MTDEALHLVSGAEPGSATEATTAFDLFARVLLGRAPGTRSAYLVKWSRSEASREVAAGRVPVAGAEVAAYRLLYRAARAEAATVRSTDPVSAKTRWEAAMEGLATLRHRQRAAVALRFLAGLSVAEVADVLGVREPQARGIVEAGIAGVVKAVGGPIDVRRALRVAVQRLVAPEKPVEKAAEPPIAMPRSVMRTLLAPPPVLGPMPAEGVSPVEVLLAPLLAPLPETAVAFGEAPGPAAEAPPEPLRIPEPPPLPAPIPLDIVPVRKPRRVLAPAWSREALPRRLAVAIAVAMLAAVTLAPSPSRPPVLGLPTIHAAASIAAEDAPRLEARLAAQRLFALLPTGDRPGILVRRGDSLWTIAARALGDARRWPELWRANRGRAMAGGERFVNPAVIRPGWMLALPRGPA